MVNGKIPCRLKDATLTALSLLNDPDRLGTIKTVPPSSFILHPSSFILPPSSFLHKPYAIFTLAASIFINPS
jgi:hypothetical protein